MPPKGRFAIETVPCRRCSECAEGPHHWLEHVAYPGPSDDGSHEVEFAGYICKHCEVLADICERCEGPVFPITGQVACAECAADEDDFGEAPYVCPGCHAVAEPCHPGCIDAAIEAQLEWERERDG